MSTDFPTFTKTFHCSVYPSIDPTNISLSAAGKVVVVTGGGQGIGKAIATSFAKAGARVVVIIGRTGSSLEATKKEIRGTKEVEDATATRSFEIDISHTQSVDEAFRAIRDEFGGIDITVNNAGSLYLSTIEACDVDSYCASLDTNVKGTLNIMRALSHCRPNDDKKTPATFINLSTIGIAMPIIPTWSNYVASKLAAFSMPQFLAAESGGKLRTFSIHPGRVATDMAIKAGVPTFDDPELPGAFCVWLAATANADFLQHRLVACNWDVDELLEMKEEIERKDLLKLKFAGLDVGFAKGGDA